jgi:hypothetical protein
MLASGARDARQGLRASTEAGADAAVRLRTCYGIVIDMPDCQTGLAGVYLGLNITFIALLVIITPLRS